jgi:hypothetical protein
MTKTIDMRPRCELCGHVAKLAWIARFRSRDNMITVEHWNRRMGFVCLWCLNRSIQISAICPWRSFYNPSAGTVVEC